MSVVPLLGVVSEARLDLGADVEDIVSLLEIVNIDSITQVGKQRKCRCAAFLLLQKVEVQDDGFRCFRRITSTSIGVFM